ncbi:uncharacterized protein RAG0_02008 [Rhynchosporium agropyri]|uniref:Uncharacterized protein n=1 Tax=Rhynchosporium agropyri TaxID=914238 RepID=A0A1E1JZX1_9HELO|nr:uncharacterized protein RAG0_02008 [Rhynchosporium agropyri]
MPAELNQPKIRNGDRVALSLADGSQEVFDRLLLQRTPQLHCVYEGQTQARKRQLFLSTLE